jgi:ribonuclease HI
MRKTLDLLYSHPTKFAVLTRGSFHRPSYTARVQTDGSFSVKYKPISRTAIILTTSKGDQHSLCTTYFDHKNHVESEWCSVLEGIKYSLKKDQDAIELENDNLGVINSLVNHRIPRHSYLSDYYLMIYKYLPQFEYVGIRWIPRELNRADDLFRI